jgi:U32 family peptidase
LSGTELIITVSSPRELEGTDLSPYDAVCLGNPYCRRVEGNFAEDPALMRGAVALLHAAGKKAYVTSPAAPRGRDLPRVDRLIEAAAAAGADALEVHNMGVLRRLREKGDPLPAHMGAFANVYTHLGAKVMRDYGAVRVRPNAEVSLEEMAVIAEEGGVEVEAFVHGKIPLGVTDRCFLLEGPEETDPNCPASCREERWLVPGRRGVQGGFPREAGLVPPKRGKVLPENEEERRIETEGEPLRSRREGGWILKTVGKGVLSGKDMCMLEHLPLLLGRGFRIFKVEGLYETHAYRGEIGAVYRDALALAASGEPYGIRPEWAETVRRHSRFGLCNGYCFGRTGRLYVGDVLHTPDPEV